MRKTSLLHAAVASLALVAGTAVHAQTYSNAVVTLNPPPVGYWPLQETTPPPTPGSLNLTAHNSGTLGTAGDGLYGAWYQASGASWYLTNSVVLTNAQYTGDSSKALLCQSVYQTYIPGQYVVVPHATNGVANDALTIKPPFSVECWAYIGSTNPVARVLVAQGATRLDCGNTDPNNPYNGGTFLGLGGFELAQYRDYLFFMPLCTNNYSKPELDTPPGWNNGVNGAGLKVGTLLHVVATMDEAGTKTIYTNGVLCATSGTTANKAGLYYVPDPAAPIMIGAGPEVSVSTVVPAESVYNPYSGVLDDVAIYTNALSVDQALAHYQAAANGTYAATVQGDNPLLFYRFDDSIAPANAGYNTATFPTAKNYGSEGVNANGLYQPGTTPGVAGPSFSGFGANSRAVALNGAFGTVNIGNGNLPLSLNPTGAVALTVVSWFKGGPADSPNRFQEIVGHGDSSYRLALGQAAGDNHFNAGPGPELQFDNLADETTNGFALNDGHWHMVAGVSDGTHEYLYLDGRLAKSATNTSGIKIVGTTNDLVLGGDPQYTYADGANQNTIRNFNGSIAHVAFWTNALTTAQIQQLYGAAGVPPTITQQPPATKNINAGAPLSVPVMANGSAPLSYQWYKNGGSLSTQTTSTLTINSVGLGDAGTYSVRVSNSGGNVTSSNMVLTVNGPPVLTNQSPTTMQVFAGTQPVLHASAYGPPTITYQWSKNGSAISGATQSAYQLSTNTDTKNLGSASYTCAIQNTYGAVSPAFTAITVQVLAAPTATYPAQVLKDNPAYYFRLDEAGDGGYYNNGATAWDNAGGCNAVYTNAYLAQPGYAPSTDPSETSVYFGYSATGDSFAGNGSTYLDFSAPAGSNAQFSVEAWINPTYMPSTDSGVVAIGYGYGGEQFALDFGGNNSSARALRFYVNDANNVNYGITALSTTNFWDPANYGKWHHVVAVCDEAGGNVSLYVDGLLGGSSPITAKAGLKALTAPLSIGARLPNGSTNAYLNQFQGYINDVSLYNVALSSSQVLSHYMAAGTAPTIAQAPPATVVTNEGATLVLSATVVGTAPISLQWQANGVDIPGANTATLTLPNVQRSMSMNIYTLNAVNGFGTASTAPVGTTLTVNYGAPTFTADLTTAPATNYVGSATTYAVSVIGTEPFSYQWYQDGAVVSGATRSSYTFTTLSGQHTYYVRVSGQGSVNSSTATLTGIAVPTLNPSDYTYTTRITFKGYNRTEGLSDFPALVVLTNIPGFAYSQLADPNGGDLRFTDASGTREIPHEIDEWNPAGNSTVWVQVPHLATNTDSIVAYWGNPAAKTPEAWSTNGGVWVPPAFEGRPAYQRVYHLKEGNYPFLDSTAQHSVTNGSGTAPTATAALVGNGASFSGSEWLDAGTNDLGDAFTWSAWVNLPTGTYDIQVIWANRKGSTSSDGVGMWMNFYHTSDQQLELASGNGSSGLETLSSPTQKVPFGSWHQVASVVNRTNGTVDFFCDGANIGSGAVVKDFKRTDDLRLGVLLDNFFGFHGGMDEARVQSGNASANWLWADYMTLAQNTTFEDYGAGVAGPVYITVTNLGGGQLQLSWPQGTLQTATGLNGQWQTLTATSPYTVSTTGHAAQFFRVQVK